MHYETLMQGNWIPFYNYRNTRIESRDDAKWVALSTDRPVREVDSGGLVWWEIYPYQGRPIIRTPLDTSAPVDQDAITVPEAKVA